MTVQRVALGLGPDHVHPDSVDATIKQGQTVTVSYDSSLVPDTGTVIADTAGNPAVAFTDFAVTNNSTVDGTPPIPASAEVPSSGDVLTLTFNEDLDIAGDRLPPADAFTVKADGVAVTVQRRGAGPPVRTTSS